MRYIIYVQLDKIQISLQHLSQSYPMSPQRSFKFRKESNSTLSFKTSCRILEYQNEPTYLSSVGTDQTASWLKNRIAKLWPFFFIGINVNSKYLLAYISFITLHSRGVLNKLLTFTTASLGWAGKLRKYKPTSFLSVLLNNMLLSFT